MTTDFHLANHGSICILTPLTPEAHAWADEHISDTATRWGEHGIVIEPRYADPVILGLVDDGLSITLENA